jgi:hypothetical protein
MFDRSDEDIAAGVIRLSLGGQDYILPTLKWADSEVWQADLQKRLMELTGRDHPDIDAAIESLSGALNVMVDLVSDYDRTHVLGKDADDLKRTLDRAQMYETFKAIARHEFPFIRDAEGLGAMVMPYLRPILMSLLANLWDQRKPSNGPSPTGDSTPALSEADSTTVSSDSSGEQAKAA